MNGCQVGVNATASPKSSSHEVVPTAAHVLQTPPHGSVSRSGNCTRTTWLPSPDRPQNEIPACALASTDTGTGCVFRSYVRPASHSLKGACPPCARTMFARETESAKSNPNPTPQRTSPPPVTSLAWRPARKGTNAGGCPSGGTTEPGGGGDSNTGGAELGIVRSEKVYQLAFADRSAVGAAGSALRGGGARV